MKRRLQVDLICAAAGLIGVVFAAPAQAVITHRYSFTGNANDSVGTLNLTTNGGAAFASGQVTLDGVDDSLSAATSPVPTAANSSVTIEVWGTYSPTTAVGSRIFDFADGAGSTFLYMTPRATPGTPDNNPADVPVGFSNTRVRWDDGFGQDLGPMAPSSSATGQEVLLTLVYDRSTVTTVGNGEFRLYRDGGLIASDPGDGLDIFGPGELADATIFRLGHGASMPPGTTLRDLPAFLTGSMNEFRVYNNPLTTLEVLTNAISGPDVTSVAFTDKTWNAAGPSSWNTGGNWTAAGVPSTANRAIIGNGATATVSAATPQTGAIRITNGTLTIGSGGTLNSQYPIELTTGAANTATINVNNGGRLILSGIVPDTGAGAKNLNVDGGVIQPGFKSALVTTGMTTNVGAGGLTFDTGADQLTWTSALAGGAGTSITKIGSGRLSLRSATTDRTLQNQSFLGELHVNAGTVDIDTALGALGHGGSSTFGNVFFENGTALVLNTDFNKEFGTQLHINGNVALVNNVARAAREIRMRGSISGSGTLTFTKPNLADALGIDFENEPNPLDPNVPFVADNSGFTGRIVTAGNWAVRFKSDLSDIPNAILEMTDPGAWTAKRGTDTNQIIQLGGIAGVALSRLQASTAGEGDVLADVTYEIGGASQNAEFFGIVQDNVATDNVTIIKVGNNTQAFSGPNTYSGTTTINAGTLLVNGTHQMHATQLIPVGDYTVNAGGTLGGNGAIGAAADPVDVIANGGTIAPGASIGTLTVNGNVTLGASSHFGVELSGATADKLAVVGNLDLSALGNVLDVTGAGSNPTGWVIASYTGSLVGTFESITSGFSVNYGTGANSQITLTSTGPVGVQGDYNQNGIVDAADYTVWRDHLGQTFALPNRNILNSGAISTADYTFWKSRFGATSGSGSGASAGAVPEPATWTLIVLTSVLLLVGRRDR